MLSIADFLQNVCDVVLLEENPVNITEILVQVREDEAAAELIAKSRALCDNYNGHLCATLGTVSRDLEVERQGKCRADLAGCANVWCDTDSLGLKWRKTAFSRSFQPTSGQVLENVELVKALALNERMYAGNGNFNQEKWASFGIKDLRKDDYVLVGDNYFKPIGGLVLPILEEAVVMNLNCTYDQQSTIDALIPSETELWDQSDWYKVMRCVTGMLLPFTQSFEQQQWRRNGDLYREMFNFTATRGTLIVNITFSSEKQVEPVHKIFSFFESWCPLVPHTDTLR